MPGFASGTSPSTFLGDYQRVVESRDAGTVAEWLFSTVQDNMTSEIFHSPTVDWKGFDPIHVLVLRACAPQGIFTPAVKAEYLERVKGDAELEGIAEALFGTDHSLIVKLPDGYDDIKVELVEFQRLAYLKGIRPSDSRIDFMLK